MRIHFELPKAEVSISPEKLINKIIEDTKPAFVGYATYEGITLTKTKYLNAKKEA